jgi:hypothetical protein
VGEHFRARGAGRNPIAIRALNQWRARRGILCTTPLFAVTQKTVLPRYFSVGGLCLSRSQINVAENKQRG